MKQTDAVGVPLGGIGKATVETIIPDHVLPSIETLRSAPRGDLSTLQAKLLSEIAALNRINENLLGAANNREHMQAHLDEGRCRLRSAISGLQYLLEKMG